MSSLHPLPSPLLDVVFKLLFGAPENRELLVDLLESILRLPAGSIREVEVLGAEPRRRGRDEKGHLLDLRVRLHDERRLFIEVQNLDHPALFSRMLSYFSREYGSQLEPGQSYLALTPVVGVLILDFDPFRSLGAAPRFRRFFELREREDGTRLTENLGFHVFTLPSLSRPGAFACPDPMVKWESFCVTPTTPRCWRSSPWKTPSSRRPSAP